MKFYAITVLFYLLSSCSIFTNSTTYQRSPNSVDSNLSCQAAVQSFISFKNAESLINFEELLEKYPNLSRGEISLLGQDAAHGNIIDTRSIEEVDSMLHAQTNGLIPGPLKRDGAEVDFIDGLGRPWDIKTPVTPSYGADWSFNPKKVFNSLRHQIDMEYKGQKVRILLDFRHIKRKEKKVILNWIEENFNDEEKSRIIHIK